MDQTCGKKAPVSRLTDQFWFFPAYKYCSLTKRSCKLLPLRVNKKILASPNFLVPRHALAGYSGAASSSEINKRLP